MKNHQGNRARLGEALMAVVLGALAILALPGIGIGKDAENDYASRAAGKVESFDRRSGLLVVDLFKGRKIAGYVIRHRTKVRCHDDRRRHRFRLHRRRAGATASGTTSLRDRKGDTVAATDVRDSGEDARGPEAPETEPEEGDEGTWPPVGHSRHCLRHLVPGAIVLRAEMVLAYGDAFFRRIAIMPPPAVATTDSSGTR
ncbi:MAG TPA: hypothetical protein VFZ41_08750 [Solirubrobacterales bacterium]